MPMLIVGDFNITGQQFLESGWPSKLKVEVIKFGTNTTIRTALNRDIDFALISTPVKHLFKSVFIVLTVPWGPHFGFVIS